MDKNRLISNANNYFYLNFKFLFLNLKLKYFLIMHVSLDPLLPLVFIISNTIINKKRKEKGLCRILLTLSKENKKIT